MINKIGKKIKNIALIVSLVSIVCYIVLGLILSLVLEAVLMGVLLIIIGTISSLLLIVLLYIYGKFIDNCKEIDKNLKDISEKIKNIDKTLSISRVEECNNESVDLTDTCIDKVDEIIEN